MKILLFPFNSQILLVSRTVEKYLLVGLGLLLVDSEIYQGVYAHWNDEWPI